MGGGAVPGGGGGGCGTGRRGEASVTRRPSREAGHAVTCDSPLIPDPLYFVALKSRTT